MVFSKLRLTARKLSAVIFIFESDFRTQNFSFSPPFMGRGRRWIFFVWFSDPKFFFQSIISGLWTRMDSFLGPIFGPKIFLWAHKFIDKSYNLRCILCFFGVTIVTVYKETLSMGSSVNNNGCFDFRNKYTLPMYLECASNWYLLILENRLYKIFYKFANQTIPLSCNESR